MTKEMQCKYCDTTFEHEIYGNYSVRCPHCHRLLEHLSDYGFGPVTPFYICIGNEVIGVAEVQTNIITKMGSLWFYGESFGRPFDNIHKVKSISYDGELLIITFNEWEELFVYNPSDITSAEKELKIGQASKVKWSYIPYGSRTGRETLTYTYNGSEIIKSTENAESIVTGGRNSAAVLLAGY